MEEIERILYNLNESTRIPNATVRFSGYHPPPPHRRALGDLAYIEATLPDGVDGSPAVVHLTAFPLGFYVNRSTAVKFDPTPAINVGKKDDAPHPHCYSHSLLDTLLQKSKSLRYAWEDALMASKQRSDLLTKLSNEENTLTGMLRSVVSPYPNNVSGVGNAMMMSTITAISPTTFVPRIDSTVLCRPSWLVPLPSLKLGDTTGSKVMTSHHNEMHSWSDCRAEEELTSMYGGIEVSCGGGLRDWNEELQKAREMPVEAFGERIERAR